MLEDLTGMFGGTMGKPYGMMMTKGSFLMNNPIALTIVIVLAIFWIWMLAECLNKNFKKDMDKVSWILVLLFTNILGAILYYLLIKKK